MSDLGHIVGLIVAIFALVVGLMVLLTWLETTLYTDQPAPARARAGAARAAAPVEDESPGVPLQPVGHDEG